VGVDVTSCASIYSDGLPSTLLVWRLYDRRRSQMHYFISSLGASTRSPTQQLFDLIMRVMQQPRPNVRLPIRADEVHRPVSRHYVYEDTIHHLPLGSEENKGSSSLLASSGYSPASSAHALLDVVHATIQAATAASARAEPSSDALSRDRQDKAKSSSAEQTFLAGDGEQ
jgi:hypothetical protein